MNRMLSFPKNNRHWSQGKWNLLPVLFLVATTMLGSSPSLSQCIDYKNSIHWVGGLDLPSRAYDVAVV
jgi:hypothetical protein